jgi:hypothetical protein
MTLWCFEPWEKGLDVMVEAVESNDVDVVMILQRGHLWPLVLPSASRGLTPKTSSHIFART